MWEAKKDLRTRYILVPQYSFCQCLPHLCRLLTLKKTCPVVSKGAWQRAHVASTFTFLYGLLLKIYRVQQSIKEKSTLVLHIATTQLGTNCKPGAFPGLHSIFTRGKSFLYLSCPCFHKDIFSSYTMLVMHFSVSISSLFKSGTL